MMESPSGCVCDGTDIGAAISRMLQHRGVESVAMDTNPAWLVAFESLIQDGINCPVHPRMLYVPSQPQSFLI